MKGEGNQQDYGMRIYDPRVGRFLSVDPITAQYPELTPYQFASNTPIQAVDLDGLEAAAINFPSGVSSKERDAAIRSMNHTLVKGGGGVIYYGGMTIFGLFQPEVGVPWALTELTGIPVTPSPQAMARSVESQAARELGTAVDEAVPEVTTVARTPGNVVRAKSAKGNLSQSTANGVKQQVNSQRPSPYQSELDLVPPDAAPQVAFRNGKPVSSRTRGSVRPDGYNTPEAISTEIKNYKVTTQRGRTSLVNNVVKQVRQRLSNLPRGSTQNVIIDTRGQDVNQSILNNIRNRITTQAGSQNVNVQFKTN